MARALCRCFPLLVLTALAASAQPEPPGSAPWKFDEVELKNGARFQGLVLNEADDRIRFKTVRRQPGRATVTLTETFTRAEIKTLRSLPDADRKLLQERLAELDPTGKSEQERMDSLELVSTKWLGQKEKAKRYDSDYFTLTSSASEEVTRRAAVRLEQIYTAFARVLPPRVDGRPTDVLLAPSVEEYRTLLGRAGLPALLNPSVFDPQGGRILCGLDLRRLGSELQATRSAHRKELAAIDKYEQDARKLFRNSKPDLERYLDVAARERRKIMTMDRANDLRFDQVTAQLFEVMYHEAFHAYVTAFVYPPMPPADVKAGKGTGELPRWLNEGLAQIFETSVVEAGELRADHADKERLARTKELLRAKPGEGLVPLGDLLVAGRDLFRAAHADQAAASDRAYLTCWGLAHYLTFDRRVLGYKAFDRYISSVNTGTEPKHAFATLVGQDLPAFELEFHSYLSRLKADGTLTVLKK